MRILLPLAPLLIFPAMAAAQGMDPWDRLQRYDADGDGKITKEEFTGPDRLWERLDANRDGEVTKDEAKKMRGRGRGMQGGRRGAGSADFMKAVDTDKDGQVSKDEWDAYFKNMDENGDGHLDAGELRAAMRGQSYNDRAPKVGSPAPKVSAVRRADGKTVELTRFAKPTVLVFGSWT